MRGSRNARKLGQKIGQPTARVRVRSLANCAIPPGGKPSVARVVRSAIRVCQRGTPRGNARVGADIRRRSRRARCGEHNRYVEYPEAREKRGKSGRVRADPARSARGVRGESARGHARACPGERRCEKGRRGARGNGRGRRTSSLSLSRFLCAWVTSLATACDSSLRTDSSLTGWPTPG